MVWDQLANMLLTPITYALCQLYFVSTLACPGVMELIRPLHQPLVYTVSPLDCLICCRFRCTMAEN